jgi:hypothetical protein
MFGVGGGGVAVKVLNKGPRFVWTYDSHNLKHTVINQAQLVVIAILNKRSANLDTLRVHTFRNY